MAIIYTVSEIQLKGEFRGSSGLVDPTVVLAYTISPATPGDPDGTQNTYTYGVDPILTKDSTGKYTLTISPTIAGKWKFGFRGTGDNKGGGAGAFEVVAWPFS